MKKNIFIAAIIVALTSMSLMAKETELINVSSTEKNDNFLLNWTVLDAVPYGDNQGAMRKAYDNEAVSIAALWQSIENGQVNIGDRDYDWNTITSKTSIIDLHEHIAKEEFVYTYATTKINTEQAKSLYLGVGSDDAIKIWLNAELIHENFAARAVGIDQDLVVVNLKQGDNTLVVKVVNGILDWGFSVHSISKAHANLLFADISGNISVEALDRLLNQGIDVNAKNASGLTALHNSQINRLTIRSQQLIKRGADRNIPMPSIETLISTFFASGIDPESSGMAFLAAKNGEIIYKGGQGKANVEKNISISANTKFRIGSITKQFTAVAILKLQEQGKLSIEDPLSKYLPDFPKADQVTLRQLLNHTSGIHSYTNEPDFVEQTTKAINPQVLINKIKTFDYDFEPGSRWSYSNSGYFILGDIVERVAEKSLAQFWQENIFTPLGMKDTGVYTNGTVYTNEALGYSHENDATKRAIDWDMSHAGGAGNIYSTVEDLFVWNEALFNGKVLSPESFVDATTNAKLANGEEVNAFGSGYGLGIGLSELYGKQVVGHSGGLHGFSAYLGRIPSENLTFVSLSNSMPTNLNFKQRPFNHVAGILLGPEPIEQLADTSEATPQAPLTDYIGEFDYNPLINQITTSEGRLFTQLGGQPKLELFRSSGDHFYLNAVAAELKFQRNDSGEVVRAVHIQNGQSFKVKKIASGVFISSDVKEFARLVGNYKLNGSMTLAITKEADKLYVQPSGQPKIEILPLAALEYRAKELNIRLVFNPNSSDEKAIESLVLHQAGMAMNAAKLN